MKKRTKILAGAAVAAIGVLAATGTVLALGGDDDAQLSGSTLDRATAAALVETGPGRVTSAEQEDDGSYELEISRPDGIEVDVHLDQDLNVVRTEPEPFDEGIGSGRSTDADDLTGELLRKATAAAQVEVPGGGVTDAEHADVTGYEVSVVGPDGIEVDLRLDDAFTVTSAIPDVDD